jgi:hypothetical protein
MLNLVVSQINPIHTNFLYIFLSLALRGQHTQFSYAIWLACVRYSNETETHSLQNVSRIAGLPTSLSSFPYTTCFSFLFAFHSGRYSAFSHRSVRLFSEFSSFFGGGGGGLAWGSKTNFGFSDCGPELLLLLPGLVCFSVWLIKFW